MITITEVRNVLDKMPTEFDSHMFILKFFQFHHQSYGELLAAHNNVASAHAEIAIFLRNNSAELRINKIGETESPDIFGNISECALWAKIDNTI